VIMMAITPSLNASSLDVVITYTVPGNQPAWPQLRMRFETALCRRPTILRMEILHTAVSILINAYISGTLFAVFRNPTFLALFQKQVVPIEDGDLLNVEAYL
jgi:hypothetical protein